jgi:hypothetical protein
MSVAVDGYLPAALRRLRKAAYALADPQPQLIGGRLIHTDSRYEQLRRAVAGQSGPRFGGRNTVPLWTDALDLLTDITGTIGVWYRRDKPRDEAPTAAVVTCRLDAIAHRGWRPQDVAVLDDYSGRLETWALSIDALLSDTHVMELVAACPACGADTVERDRAGEIVRAHALQIDADGCHCLECHTQWGPRYFVHLARVIGCPLPAGVLE